MPFLSMMVICVFAYLCGALSSAIIVCKFFHLPDPRTLGSKNPGTTNVLRIGGKKYAVFVLLGDVLKGVIPVVLARYFLPMDLWGWVALSAVLGHLYPIFFHFKGGKGVATTAGVLLAFSIPLGVTVVISWVITAFLTRYSSFAALMATGVMLMYTGWFIKTKNAFLPLLMIALIVLWRHRQNIQRLLSGKEPKIGQSH